MSFSIPTFYFSPFSHVHSDEIEDFGGYQYPKPAIPFPLPTSTSNPDAESVPNGLAPSTDSARLRKG